MIIGFLFYLIAFMNSSNIEVFKVENKRNIVKDQNTAYVIDTNTETLRIELTMMTSQRKHKIFKMYNKLEIGKCYRTEIHGFKDSFFQERSIGKKEIVEVNCR